MKPCFHCKEPKAIEEFNFKSKAKNIRRNTCRACDHAIDKEKREAWKNHPKTPIDKFLSMKLG